MVVKLFRFLYNFFINITNFSSRMLIFSRILEIICKKIKIIRILTLFLYFQKLFEFQGKKLERVNRFCCIRDKLWSERRKEF